MTHSSWGPGWPNCQTSKIDTKFFVDHKHGRTSFPGGVRQEISELVFRLVRETVNRGYRFGTPSNPSYGCWGFACRPIRGSRNPSNHSWGLAVDINAPKNPMGSKLITDMPGWMPDLWNAYGFRWGGDYKTRPDAMHYEFMGSMADAGRHTSLARKNRLGEGAAPPKPQPPKPAEPEPIGDKMLSLVKGPTGPTYLTDWLTKRPVTQEDIDVAVFLTNSGGGKISTKNGKPHALSAAQADVLSRVPNA